LRRWNYVWVNYGYDNVVFRDYPGAEKPKKVSNGAVRNVKMNWSAEADQKNVSAGKPIKQESLLRPVGKQLHNHEVSDNTWV
jgi:hypothetical protein